MPDAPLVSVVDEGRVGWRLDRLVAELTGTSRSDAAALVRGGYVSVDGRVVAEGDRRVRVGERVAIQLARRHDVRNEAPALALVFEDDDLIVLDKPPGVVVHPAPGQRGPTLVDALVARYPELVELARAGICEEVRPGIVHRLDRDTSGLMVVARSPRAFESLRAQLRQRTLERRYLALVAGEPSVRRGVVEAPIGRSPRRPDRMAVVRSGRLSRTRFEVLERFELEAGARATLVEAALDTGRTHQVRVHMAAIGHPVAGDRRYGGPDALAAPDGRRLELARPLLHAWRLGLEHPGGGWHRWEAPPPADFAAVLSALRSAPPPSRPS
jgi:23S rRNA pseudouridine1911/1915/1917 synthase